MSRLLVHSAYFGLLGVLLFMLVVLPFRSGHPTDDVLSEINVEVVPKFMASNGYAVLEIRNSGQAPVYYSGYSKSHPIYQTRRLTDQGTWVLERSGFCGVGISSHRLMAGQSQEIMLGLGPGEYHIGINFGNSPGPVARSEMIWSDPALSIERQ